MIAYREQRSRIPTAEAVARVESSCGLEQRMNLGELEAGVADALCPEIDADHPSLQALREGRWQGLELPSEIEISVPEGFAYYAVDPELYRKAAQQFQAECRPEWVAVIGIRSIGTTLASQVCAALTCATKSWTVRPRGHPWNRELLVHADLAARWREWQGWFAIVDEGPGLSGSSFISVAAFLESLGIGAERIALFPSWRPDVSAFVNETARRKWPEYRCYTCSFEDLGLFAGAQDLSGGAWRKGRDIATQPQHERRKYLRDGTLHKFAGYGRYGRGKLERARLLSGFIPEPVALDSGFLSQPWVDGEGEPPAIERLAAYLAHIRRTFPTGRAAQFEPLAEMIAVNTGRDASPYRRAVADAPELLLDARMFPHEWAGTLKTDALDHYDDHFHPGPQDIAWDLAGTIIEFGFERDAEAYLLHHYAQAAGDPCAATRLPFYKLAYLAFRIGYCDLAIKGLGGSPDAALFRREHRRYLHLLELLCPTNR